MADRFSSSEKATIDRDNRNMSAASIPMSDELEDIWAAIDSGTIGITADAEDIDSLAKGGGHAEQDTDLTSGLTFHWQAFRIFDGQASQTISAGSLLLTGSTTNYVELGRDGTVYANTSSFTAGRLPLWQIATGTSSITTVTSKKPLLQLPRLIKGEQLATAGKTKSITFRVGTLSATDATIALPLPNVAGTITRIAIEVTTTVAANDTDYWTFGVLNKGTGGSGSTVVVDSTAAANSTKATGGSALTNFVQRDLTLTSTPADLVTAAKDSLLLTATKAASGANLVALTVLVEMTFEV
jgi:hypothetical protein